MQKAIDAKQKREREDDITLKEVKDKLLQQVKENSELMDQFRALKNRHVKLVEKQSLKDDHINALTHQLEAKNREVKEKNHEVKEKNRKIVSLADKKVNSIIENMHVIYRNPTAEG